MYKQGEKRSIDGTKPEVGGTKTQKNERRLSDVVDHTVLAALSLEQKDKLRENLGISQPSSSERYSDSGDVNAKRRKGDSGDSAIKLSDLRNPDRVRQLKGGFEQIIRENQRKINLLERLKEVSNPEVLEASGDFLNQSPEKRRDTFQVFKESDSIKVLQKFIKERGSKLENLRDDLKNSVIGDLASFSGMNQLVSNINAAESKGKEALKELSDQLKIDLGVKFNLYKDEFDRLRRNLTQLGETVRLRPEYLSLDDDSLKKWEVAFNNVTKFDGAVDTLNNFADEYLSSHRFKYTDINELIKDSSEIQVVGDNNRIYKEDSLTDHAKQLRYAMRKVRDIIDGDPCARIFTALEKSLE